MSLLLGALGWAEARLLAGDTAGVADSLKAVISRQPGSPEAAKALLWLEILGTGEPLKFFEALKFLKGEEYQKVLEIHASDTATAAYLDILKARALKELGEREEALRVLAERAKASGLPAAWAAWEAWKISGDEKYLRQLVRRFPKTAYGALAREALERR